VKLKTIQFSPTDQQVLVITRAGLLGRPILGPGLGEMRAKTRMKSRIPAVYDENKNDKRLHCRDPSRSLDVDRLTTCRLTKDTE
jgi:hypothetical protein